MFAPPFMPKVTFVNENRTVDVEPGRLISDVANELGIAVCRESFAGTGIGNYTVWVKGESGSVSPVTFMEKLMGARGWKRYANRARILGDCQVWTQQGLRDRLRSPRPVTAPPSPATDPSAPRKPIDAAGTAAFPFGDPREVGKGERPPVGRTTGKPKAAKAGGKAAAAAAAADESESDESESDESE
jgi:hypothetical protein